MVGSCLKLHVTQLKATSMSNCLIILAAGNALVFAPGVDSLPDTIVIQQESTRMTGHDIKGKY